MATDNQQTYNNFKMNNNKNRILMWLICFVWVWRRGIKSFIWGRRLQQLACRRWLCWGKAPCRWIRALKVRSCRLRGKRRNLRGRQDDDGKFDLWVRCIFDVQVDLETTLRRCQLLVKRKSDLIIWALSWSVILPAVYTLLWWWSSWGWRALHRAEC